MQKCKPPKLGRLSSWSAFAPLVYMRSVSPQQCLCSLTSTILRPMAALIVATWACWRHSKQQNLRRHHPSCSRNVGKQREWKWRKKLRYSAAQAAPVTTLFFPAKKRQGAAAGTSLQKKPEILLFNYQSRCKTMAAAEFRDHRSRGVAGDRCKMEAKTNTSTNNNGSCCWCSAWWEKHINNSKATQNTKNKNSSHHAHSYRRFYLWKCAASGCIWKHPGWVLSVLCTLRKAWMNC